MCETCDTMAEQVRRDPQPAITMALGAANRARGRFGLALLSEIPRGHRKSWRVCPMHNALLPFSDLIPIEVLFTADERRDMGPFIAAFDRGLLPQFEAASMFPLGRAAPLLDEDFVHNFLLAA